MSHLWAFAEGRKGNRLRITYIEGERTDVSRRPAGRTHARGTMATAAAASVAAVLTASRRALQLARAANVPSLATTLQAAAARSPQAVHGDRLPLLTGTKLGVAEALQGAAADDEVLHSVAAALPVPLEAHSGANGVIELTQDQLAVAQLVADMRATVIGANALGLAAPQVRHSVRAFVMRAPRTWLDEAEFTTDPARQHKPAAPAWRTPGGRRRGRGRRRRRVFGSDDVDVDAATPGLPLDADAEYDPSEWVVAHDAEAEAPAFIACLNPRVTAVSEERVLGFEACLSVPDEAPLVLRHAAVDVEFTACDGVTVVRRRMRGLPGVVFQHELDHLNGRLITENDRAATVDVITNGGNGPTLEQAMEDAAARYDAELQRHYPGP